MRVSEKSLELNIGAELLYILRYRQGMNQAYLQGLTQKEENDQGVDFFARLGPHTFIFAFQFKAPKKNSCEIHPYAYTLQREQHTKLYNLSQTHSDAVFYVFPFFRSHPKLRRTVPNLSRDTWLLRAASVPVMPTFMWRKSRKLKNTTTVECWPHVASINPNYELMQLAEMPFNIESGIPSEYFAEWYKDLRNIEVSEKEKFRRINPWLVRGLRIAIIERSR